MTGILTHAAARRATTATLDEAASDGLPPVCLCVSDPSGSLVVFDRMDSAPERLIAIVTAKAYTAARMRCSTGEFRCRLQAERLTLQDFCDPGLTSLPGGMPVFADGRMVAAVGVSGRRLEEDEALARFYAEHLLLELQNS